MLNESIAHLVDAATAFAEPFRATDPFDRMFTSRRFDINLATSHSADGYGWQLYAYDDQGQHVATVTLALGSDKAVAEVNPAAANKLSDLAYTMDYHTASLVTGKAAA